LGLTRQIRELAHALLTHGPVGAGALLILGVPPEWIASAAALLDHLDLGRTTAVAWAIEPSVTAVVELRNEAAA
jgi:hypothetical protein